MSYRRNHDVHPCPFCGGGNTAVQVTDVAGFVAYVVCLDCDEARGPLSSKKYQDIEPAEDDAIRLWNTRASDAEITRLRAEVARKDEALRSLSGELDTLINADGFRELRVVQKQVTAALADADTKPQTGG